MNTVPDKVDMDLLRPSPVSKSKVPRRDCRGFVPVLEYRFRDLRERTGFLYRGSVTRLVFLVKDVDSVMAVDFCRLLIVRDLFL